MADASDADRAPVKIDLSPQKPFKVRRRRCAFVSRCQHCFCACGKRTCAAAFWCVWRSARRFILFPSLARSQSRAAHVSPVSGFRTPERTSGLLESPRQNKQTPRERIDAFGVFSLPASIHVVLSYLYSTFQLFEMSNPLTCLFRRKDDTVHLWPFIFMNARTCTVLAS